MVLCLQVDINCRFRLPGEESGALYRSHFSQDLTGPAKDAKDSLEVIHSTCILSLSLWDALLEDPPPFFWALYFWKFKKAKRAEKTHYIFLQIF